MMKLSLLVNGPLSFPGKSRYPTGPLHTKVAYQVQRSSLAESVQFVFMTISVGDYYWASARTTMNNSLTDNWERQTPKFANESFPFEHAGIRMRTFITNSAISNM